MMKMLTGRKFAAKLFGGYVKFSHVRNMMMNFRNYRSYVNFSNEYENMMMKEKSSPLLVNYGYGSFMMLPYSIIHADRAHRCGEITAQFPNNYMVAGPCDGLFCLYSSMGEICIWNPSSGSIRTVPPGPPAHENFTIETVGFGFDSKVEEYKILRCITRKGFVHQIEILSMTMAKENREWREIPVMGEIAAILASYIHSPASFADGACCWGTEWDDGDGIRLISFDVAEEEFHVHTLPPDPKGLRCCHMDTFNGQPAAIRYCPHDAAVHAQLWVRMPGEDDGVKTWVYQMDIGPFDEAIPFLTSTKRHDVGGADWMPVCLWNKDGLILLNTDYSLVYYDFSTKEAHNSGFSLLHEFPDLVLDTEHPVIQVLKFP